MCGAPCAARLRRRLGDAAGLAVFGVNLLRLSPGTRSSQLDQSTLVHAHELDDAAEAVRAGFVAEVIAQRHAGRAVALDPG